jgi:DnaJ domain
MTPASDPYRTLGLPRSASLDEVKAAYRKLAKANHPDAAGPTALPRWLAIQAAYEQLVHGTNPARVRPAPSRPTAADPDRADATHRAYGGRPRRAGTAPKAPNTGRDAGGSGPSGPANRPGSAGPRRSSGPAGTNAGTGSAASGEAPRGARGRNKATLGSTSYDGADAGPFEPDWGGASWYGTTSGTYWTINPKEYADPRKHGPEYQARARRAAAGARSETGDRAARDAAATPDARVDDASADPFPSEPAHDPGPTHTTSSWWRSTAGPTGAPFAADPAPARPGSRAADTRRPPAADSAGAPLPPPPDLAAAATDLGRALTDERAAHGRWRLVQAVVGWLPIVLGVGWLVGESTGCGRFAATCNGGVSALMPLIAVAVLAVLLLVPRLAALAAAGAVAVIVAAVPTTLLLSATGEAADIEARNALLGVVLVVAWIVGLGIGIARRLRAVDTLSGPAGPVS